MSKKLTGQLFIRNAHHVDPVSGRRLVMVVGVLALDEATSKLAPDEHLVTVTGEDGVLYIVSEPKDISSISLGRPAGDMLLQSIWRT